MLLTFFFFNATATTEIYTLSLHDALPIFARPRAAAEHAEAEGRAFFFCEEDKLKRDRSRRVRAEDFQRDHDAREDRKSTRLNSSHSQISYAVFCLKKKKKKQKRKTTNKKT